MRNQTSLFILVGVGLFLIFGLSNAVYAVSANWEATGTGTKEITVGGRFHAHNFGYWHTHFENSEYACFLWDYYFGGRPRFHLQERGGWDHVRDIHKHCVGRICLNEETFDAAISSGNYFAWAKPNANTFIIYDSCSDHEHDPGFCSELEDQGLLFTLHYKDGGQEETCREVYEWRRTCTLLHWHDRFFHWHPGTSKTVPWTSTESGTYSATCNSVGQEIKIKDLSQSPNNDAVYNVTDDSVEIKTFIKNNTELWAEMDSQFCDEVPSILEPPESSAPPESLPEVNTPPVISGPLSVTQGEQCSTPLSVTLSWNYFDPDGDPQSAYRVQIDDDSNFGSVDIDSGKVNSSSQSFTTSALSFDTTYFWRVRVWDSNDTPSSYAEGPDFTTILHAAPDVDFSWDPASPSAGRPVQFSDESQTFGGTAISNWNWDFEDGSPASSVEQNPTTTFASSGSKTVTLAVTDSDNLTCSESQTVEVGIGLPEWQEITPRQ